jgi:hypothetical protein
MRAFDRYKRDYSGTRELVHVWSEVHLRGRRFIHRDIVWLYDAWDLREIREIHRYALYIDSIYDSRDNDESRPICGGGEAPPHTD